MRTREQTEALHRQQRRYRGFQDELNGSLAAFERVVEWPDLIKCLTNVGRVLNKYAAVEHLPSLVLLAKRLSQCLNPALPSGVHLKTIELYTAVFARIGKDRLLQNLGLFSAGLFPFLASCPSKVRPRLLDLYDQVYLPLGKGLVPSLGGLIPALLPGIEDHTSAIYERVMHMLHQIRESCSTSIFAVALWRCMLLCPPSRLAAVNYLSVSIPPGSNCIDDFLPANRAIAAEAMVATLHDENVLSQRGMLEILLNHFPVDSGLLGDDQMVDVLHGALPVLLRRETSVNRRFFSWLLNQEKDASESTQRIVGDAVLNRMTSALKGETQATLPFGLVTLFMEQPIFAQSRLLERLAIHLIGYALHWHCKLEDASGAGEEETIQSVLEGAQSFFQTQQSKRLWSCIASIVSDAFAQDTVSVEEELPFMTLREPRSQAIVITEFALQWLPIEQSEGSSRTEALIELVRILLRQVPQLSWAGLTQPLDRTLQFLLNCTASLPLEHSALTREEVESFCTSFPLPTPAALAHPTSFGSTASGVMLRWDGDYSMSDDITSLDDYAIKACSTLLHLVHLLLCRISSTDLQCRFLRYVFALSITDHPEIACVGAYYAFSAIQEGDARQYAAIDLSSLYAGTAERLWALLDAQYAQHHYRVAELLCTLERLDEAVVTHVLADSMLEKEGTDHHRKFSVLWSLSGEVLDGAPAFSNSLFLMLDSLDDEDPSIRLVARTWLQDSLSNLERILEVIMAVLKRECVPVDRKGHYTCLFDASLVLYCFEKVVAMLNANAESFLAQLMRMHISDTLLQLVPGHTVLCGSDPSHIDYLDFFILFALRFVQSTPSQEMNEKVFLRHIEKVRSCCAELLRSLMVSTPNQKRSLQIATFLSEPLLACLEQSIAGQNAFMQVQFLSILKSTVVEMRLDSVDADMFHGPQFRNVLFTGIKSAHNDFHKRHFGNALQLTDESLSLLSHWVWFSISLLPLLRTALAEVSFLVVSVLCEEIQNKGYDSHGESRNSAHALLLYGIRCVVLHTLQGLGTSSVSMHAAVDSSQGFYPVRMLSGILGGIFGNKDEDRQRTDEHTIPYLEEAKTSLFTLFPVLVEAVVHCWNRAQSKVSGEVHPRRLYQGSQRDTSVHASQKIQKEVLQMLSPLMETDPDAIIAGFLHTWEKYLSTRKESECAATHTAILEMINALKPHDSCAMVQSLVTIILTTLEETQPKTSRLLGPIDISPLQIHETAALHMLSTYVHKCADPSQLDNAWPHILNLIKRCLKLSRHPFSFLWLLGLLHQFIQRYALQSLESKSRKEVRDTAQQLLHTCCVAASQRNVAEETTSHTVPLPQLLRCEPSPGDWGEESRDDMPPRYPWFVDGAPHDDSTSLVSLASLANVMNIVVHSVWGYRPERACQVLGPLLSPIMLLFHSHEPEHEAHVQAASALLASFSVSRLSYSVKAWRKEAWNHFMKKGFFHKSLSSLSYWRWITGTILASDPSLFAELLGRPLNQPALFKSHKTDVDERAAKMKRLAFVLHSGRIDQYARELPRIMEQLVETLKMDRADSLHEETLRCTRILLTRVSPEHFQPIWPVVLTELITVFEESVDLRLLLSACKFVDVALVVVPRHFQLYQWMFLADRIIAQESDGANVLYTNEFTGYIPHMLNLSNRLRDLDPEADETKTESAMEEAFTGRPVLRMRYIHTLSDLNSFPDRLCSWAAKQTLAIHDPDTVFINRLLLHEFSSLRTAPNILPQGRAVSE